MGKRSLINMSEKFSLRWNNFGSNVSKSFGLFRNEDYLHDVTLVTDDQHTVTAHKLILSASSEYFANIFKNTKITNPFLCLEGITSIDLTNILDYIYNGEAEIYQEHLDRFLAVAQRFKLEGLLDGQGEKDLEVNPVLESNSGLDNSPNDDFSNLVVKSEKDRPKPKQPNALIRNKPVTRDLPSTVIDTINKPQSLDGPNLHELDQKLLEHMERDVTTRNYCCKLCGKTMMEKQNMKFHVESHIEGLSFPCNVCGKEFR